MKFVVDVSFRKFLPICLSVFLVLKAVLSLYMLKVTGAFASIKAVASSYNELFGVIMSLVLAMWFLSVFLYMIEKIGRHRISITTLITVLFAVVRYLTVSLYITGLTQDSAWLIFYIVIDFILFLLLLAYTVGLLIKSIRGYREYKRNNKKNYTLKDELERRYTGSKYIQ